MSTTCHYCGGSNLFKFYPMALCSNRHDEKSYDIMMSEYELDKKNEELIHQRKVSKVFDKLRNQ